MSDTTNTEMIRLSDALAAANASVAELERERDQLALSLSATKAERDHAVRSAELLEDELHNSESARRDFEHAWLEGRAIMAVSMYFGRMRGPDAWLHAGSWEDSPELFACAGVDLRSFQHGTRFYAGSAPVPAAQTDILASATQYAHDIVTWLHRDHYADNTTFEPFDDLLGLLSQIDNMICGWKAGAQAEAKVADDVVGNEWTDVIRELMAVASYRPACQKYVLEYCRCFECVNERAVGLLSRNAAMLAAKATGGGG